MAVFFDDEYKAAAQKFDEVFPGADWGSEGCGLSADEVIALMRKSVAEGVDHLSPSYPDYSGDTIIA